MNTLRFALCNSTISPEMDVLSTAVALHTVLCKSSFSAMLLVISIIVYISGSRLRHY